MFYIGLRSPFVAGSLTPKRTPTPVKPLIRSSSSNTYQLNANMAPRNLEEDHSPEGFEEAMHRAGRIDHARMYEEWEQAIRVADAIFRDSPGYQALPDALKLAHERDLEMLLRGLEQARARAFRAWQENHD